MFSLAGCWSKVRFQPFYIYISSVPYRSPYQLIPHLLSPTRKSACGVVGRWFGCFFILRFPEVSFALYTPSTSLYLFSSKLLYCSPPPIHLSARPSNQPFPFVFVYLFIFFTVFIKALQSDLEGCLADRNLFLLCVLIRKAGVVI